jgi:hypothetical protein
VIYFRLAIATAILSAGTLGIQQDELALVRMGGIALSLGSLLLGFAFGQYVKQ